MLKERPRKVGGGINCVGLLEVIGSAERIKERKRVIGSRLYKGKAGYRKRRECYTKEAQSSDRKSFYSL